MTVTPELEAPRPVEGPGFSDALTFAFGDERAEVYGLARLGLSGGQASGLVVLFRGREPAVVRAEGAVEVGGQPAWKAVRAAGLSTTVHEPLARWTVRAQDAFELTFEAAGAPAELENGGMASYEQLCTVTGTVAGGGRVDCLGQRGHAWGIPDWEKMELARTVGAWLDPDLAVLLSAIRPAGESEHGGESVRAVILEGTPVVVHEIDDPRLSTTYDSDQRQRRAGFELWPDEEGHVVRRGAGEVLCGTSLDLGRLRLDCAFFSWRLEGRTGVGRYDVLRRAA